MSHGDEDNLKLARVRQVSASREITTLSPRALEHQKQRLATLPQGSVGLCAVLVCPVVRVSGAAKVSGAPFLLGQDGKEKISQANWKASYGKEH
jgi:hypothetical protein